MTETSASFSGNTSEDYINKPASCGPAPIVGAMRVMNADGTRELPAGEVGELWARGPMVVKGYWNNPQATAQTFIDGWLRTGDIARIDADGFCYIVDRAKDMLIRGGENIYCIEVENVLFEHPAVMDAALVGIPHSVLGEEPGAVVQLSPARRPPSTSCVAGSRAGSPPSKSPSGLCSGATLCRAIPRARFSRTS
jgi:long-chain acyl-CoA synthetase